jgi:N-acetylglucosaminyldiphosphoundecaprenol N-acetyl-beta-D-mannosaminyltransferase
MNIDKDFSRNIWCLLGLPFDAITLEQTAFEILSAANKHQSCFLSTPNLNFLCASQTDNSFRASVINSDLSIADGFPIVLIAKLLSIPISKRVAGSDLIEHLYKRVTTVPLRVFFFGGEMGAGELASQKINRKPAGLLAVGHYTPGFGSVDEMSTPEIINAINQHDVEFLIVSLGAKKGQAWIEKNRHQLNAPVISHLGAVINFFAGSVKRAPVLAQRLSMEWLWRIYQEPALWRRYYNDGISFLGMLSCSILPYWFWLKFIQSEASDQTVEINILNEPKDTKHILLTGYCTYRTISPLRGAFKRVAAEKHDVVLDLKNVTVIDSAFLGLCLVLYKHLKASGNSLNLINPNKVVRRILKWQKVNDLLSIN